MYTKSEKIEIETIFTYKDGSKEANKVTRIITIDGELYYSSTMNPELWIGEDSPLYLFDLWLHGCLSKKKRESL